VTYTNEFNQPIGSLVNNWQPAHLPTKTSIFGRWCALEPLEPAKHAENLFYALMKDNKGESWTYLLYGPFHSFSEFQAWLLHLSLGNDPFFYAIIDSATRLPVGMASYLRIVPEHGVIEVGHLHFSNELKQTAAATEAMFLMMRHVFDELGYRRYEWKCNSLNEPSRKAALRLGFNYEGTFRQDRIIKNHNRDTDWFSIIDSEWPQLRRRFELWLNPNNFCADKNQIMRLGDIS
jgi:RimJ/RimL family protein N-acetyltransferase